MAAASLAKCVQMTRLAAPEMARCPPLCPVHSSLHTTHPDSHTYALVAHPHTHAHAHIHAHKDIHSRARTFTIIASPAASMASADVHVCGQGCDRTRKPPALEGVCTGDSNAICGADSECDGFGKCLLGRQCEKTGESCQIDKHCPGNRHCLRHGHCSGSSTICNDNDDCDGNHDCIPAKEDRDRSSKNGESESGNAQNGESESGNAENGESESGEDENGKSESGEDENGESGSGEDENGASGSGVGKGAGSVPGKGSEASANKGSESGQNQKEGSTGNKALDAELEKPILQIPKDGLGKNLSPAVKAAVNSEINKFVAQIPDSLLDKVPGLKDKMGKSTAFCLAGKCVPFMKASPPKSNKMPQCLLCCMFKVCIETDPGAKLLSALKSVGTAAKPDVVQGILEKMGAAAANGGAGGAAGALRNAKAGNVAALIAAATAPAGGGGGKAGKSTGGAAAPRTNLVAKSRLDKIQRLTLQAAVEAKAKIDIAKAQEAEATSNDSAEGGGSIAGGGKKTSKTGSGGEGVAEDGNPGGLVGRDSRGKMSDEAIPTGAAVTVDGLEVRVNMLLFAAGCSWL